MMPWLSYTQTLYFVCRKKKKAVSFEPLARSLQSKLLTTSQEMKRLKDRLTKTDNKFNKERLKSSKKLKLILDALEEKQVWKDHALMAAVEQLVCCLPLSLLVVVQYSLTTEIVVGL